MISHSSSEKRLWWRPSQRPSSRRMQGQNLAHKSLPWGRRFFSLMEASVKVKFWPIRSDDGPKPTSYYKSIECIGICYVRDAYLRPLWFFSCMLSGSSGMRSRVNLSFNLEKFKNSSTLKFQSLMANMICRDKREIWDFWCLSFFAGVSWYQGPQKHAQPIGFISKMPPFPAKKTVQNLLPHVPCCQKKRDSPSFAKKLKTGWGGLGGFSSAVSKAPIRPF